MQDGPSVGLELKLTEFEIFEGPEGNQANRRALYQLIHEGEINWLEEEVEGRLPA